MKEDYIGNKILTERKKHNLTQKQLGKFISVSDKTISKWECNASYPDITILSKLCEVLEISVSELLSEQPYNQQAALATSLIISTTQITKEKKSKRIILIIALLILASSIILGIRLVKTKYQNQILLDNLSIPSKLTKDYQTLLQYKNDYVGNASNMGNLLSNLPLANYGFVQEIDNQNLIVYYKGATWNINTLENDESFCDKAILYNVNLLFHLIGNLNQVTFNFSGSSYQMKRDQFNDSFNHKQLVVDLKKEEYVKAQMKLFNVKE
ncbi:MAG: DUF4825 domain-containing protein [Erysipelotrichaceae bacterium]